jgi:hypothetical protein
MRKQSREAKKKRNKKRNFWKLTCVKLKEELDLIGLLKTGTKGVFVSRLQSFEFEMKKEKWKEVKLCFSRNLFFFYLCNFCTTNTGNKGTRSKSESHIIRKPNVCTFY